jgi:2-polyprenyl-3-methyl-5-hydroxy-6-metoxy-1,4-benzoquinol methylase
MATLLQPYMKVLDAGCGPGILSCAAARLCSRVSAFDGSTQMIAIAQQRSASLGIKNIDFRVGLVADDNVFYGCKFHAILCSSVLEYVPDLNSTLEWLIRRLLPGGVLLVSMPNGQSLYRKLERLAFRATGLPRYYAFVKHLPRPAEFAEALESRGLVVVDLRYYAATIALPEPARRAGWSALLDNLFLIVGRLSDDSMGTI